MQCQSRLSIQSRSHNLVILHHRRPLTLPFCLSSLLTFSVTLISHSFIIIFRFTEVNSRLHIHTHTQILSLLLPSNIIMGRLYVVHVYVSKTSLYLQDHRVPTKCVFYMHVHSFFYPVVCILVLFLNTPTENDSSMCTH